MQVNVSTEEQFPVEGSMYGQWEKLGIVCNDNGMPIMNLSNAFQALENHPKIKDAIWFDEFHRRCFTGNPKREWTDADTLELTAWLQRSLYFRRITKETVGDAVTMIAMRRRKNEPLDWLNGLVWDGTERIAHVFEDCLGVQASDYVRAVSKNFFISMVARILKPGCQVDNMVVLEGAQGGGKTSALRIIGGDWYTEANESVTSRDFFMVLHGKILVEIAELDSFNHAEVTRIKQVITSKVDRFRAPYARNAEDFPRMSIFVGTTNKDSYLRDATGGRRFWPVKCGGIDLESLSANRDQYFAEAVTAFKGGASWWEVPLEALDEQESRRKQDEWEIIISDWIEKLGVTLPEKFPLLKVAVEAIGIDPKDLGLRDQIRIGQVLRKLGFKNIGVRNGPKTFKLWTRAPIEQELPSIQGNTNAQG